MDRSLDEIVAESQQGKKRGSRPRRAGGGSSSNSGRPRERDYPRDGIRKLTKEYSNDTRGTKIKVDNLHYELNKEDLEGLFGSLGLVIKVELLYDRAGRSEGTAFVTYEEYADAKKAVREFDGANAKGQPIRLTIMPSAPRRNAFDTAQMPGRSLAERITMPSDRLRSLSPHRYPDGVDRYVPGRRHSGSPRRRGGGGGGRRPGARREAGGQNGRDAREPRESREGRGRDGRPRKTQEELDAEMADYFAPSGAPASAPAEEAPVANGDDIDMIS